jgi:hypothetical protein
MPSSKANTSPRPGKPASAAMARIMALPSLNAKDANSVVSGRSMILSEILDLIPKAPQSPASGCGASTGSWRSD